MLAEADALERLHQDLGVYGDRSNYLTNIETELAGLEAALRAGMQCLALTGSFSALETLRLSSAVRLACEEAAKNLQKALDEREKIIEKTQDLNMQIETREMQLRALLETDLTRLRDALSAAAGATDANKTLLAGQSEVKQLIQETKDLHEQLTGAPEDLDGTAELSVPARSTIRRVGDEMDRIKREIKIEASKIIEGKKRIESIQAELGRMERRGELPSEHALRKTRDHRDHGWSLVLSEWKGQGAQEELVPGKVVEDAFPQAIILADNIADQLREQAEAVAQAEEKRFQITQAEKQNQEAEEAIYGVSGQNEGMPGLMGGALAAL